MLTDLNELLEAHSRGEDTPEQFDDFMAKHGDYFPEQPGTLEELLDSLAQRAAAAQRLRNSLTPEQRAELDALAQQAFGSPGLMESLSRLDDSLRALRPGEDWGGSERMDGENGLGLGDGTGVFQDLADLDELAEQLSQSYEGSRLDDLDLEKLSRQLGSDAAVDARTLQRLEKALRESGTMRRASDGRLALTPKAMRQLGQGLLRTVADTMSGRRRPRRPPLRRRRRAVGVDPRVGVRRHRALGRDPDDHQRPGPAGVTGRVAIGIGDVEVQETEARTQACVALLVDTSFSMAMEGRWVPMKRTALALHTLVTQPVPRGRPAAHRLRAQRVGHADRAAGRARRPVGQGHEPPPRPAAGQPALPQAPERPARAPGRHRRRADLPPGDRAARSSSTTRRTR